MMCALRMLHKGVSCPLLLLPLSVSSHALNMLQWWVRAGAQAWGQAAWTWLLALQLTGDTMFHIFPEPLLPRLWNRDSENAYCKELLGGSE